ncbi:VIT1/CCC1 transporter family protein [Microbacterium fluvii]|uniref:VIT1/CCC1 transporter family protein n=1 Tax=Microbacterium fluvii TaxID=415215 RepID=A0ABW2HGU5_9MICO|nr:VIT1/CCC1 transporter family protein [Microbacterium fluvii]MCU4672870.1 VIT1/CCC1 transporter family protein [Microbacterium fluvii]
MRRLRETSWAIDANDGIIATAGLLQGFAGAGASDRLLLFAATAAMLAGGLSAGGAKWAETAAEREGQLAVARQEAAELAADPEGELAELTAYWAGRGLSPSLAREVAAELTARDALAAQLDAEHGLEEILAPSAPWWAGVETALAFMIGAAVPVLITYFAPVAIETWAIVVAVIVSLSLTSLVAAGVGRFSALRMLLRSLAVGLGTMGVSYLAGLVFF